MFSEMLPNGKNMTLYSEGAETWGFTELLLLKGVRVQGLGLYIIQGTTRVRI